jgi:hypothetical protein
MRDFAGKSLDFNFYKRGIYSGRKGIPIIHWLHEMPLEELIIAAFCTQTAFSQIQKTQSRFFLSVFNV